MLNLKSHFLILAFVSFFTFTLQAQRVNFCQDFQNQSIGNWVGSGVTATIQQPGPTGPGDFFLHGLDLSGPSNLTNSVDFAGDWTSVLGQCLCFDFRSIRSGTGSPPVTPRINIRDASGTLSATFVASFSVNEGDPWVNICAPIQLCAGGLPPSNADGSWVFGGSTNCTNWPNLLANVATVTIFFDFTSSPSEEVGYDNICIRNCNNNSGAYCCDTIGNLIMNGNFESGNTGFFSQYDFQAAPGPNTVEPGQYWVGTDVHGEEICPNWIVQDHSGCVGFPNNQVMFVNGRTQQATSVDNIVWEQTLIGLSEDSTYKFCGQFKNLPTCCFDILPEVTVYIDGAPIAWAPVTINTDPGDPCDWQEISMTFSPLSPSITIQIFLNHTGNGDGNDLAIDDLSLMVLPPAPVPLTVQHQSNPQVVTASYDGITSTDDILPDPTCNYQWQIGEVASVGPPVILVPGSVAFGNNSSSPAWNLTTTFPGYTFQPGVLYYIGLSVFDCECYGENTNYQLTFIAQNRTIKIGDHVFSIDEIPAILERISREDLSDIMEAFSSHRSEILEEDLSGLLEEEIFRIGRDEGTAPPLLEVLEEANLFFSPNPNSGLLNVRSEAGKANLEFCDMHGKVLETWRIEGETQFDISQYASGIYFIRYVAEGVRGVEKIVLK